MARTSKAWPVAEAKARFADLIDRAQSAGPQTITRHGKKAAVVVSMEDWERKQRRQGTLADFFANSPLRGSGLDLRRLKGKPRDTSL
jgi:prevent-host-death family protein